MKNLLIVICVGILLASCKGKSEEKSFEVNGKITNNSGTMIYLEELPMATMQAIVVDSAKVGSDGIYELHADPKESTVFNLRLDRSGYPFAALINDSKEITVNVTFSKDNKEFPEKYDVSGSDASSQMKDFMFGFNGLLQKIFMNDKAIDSMRNHEPSDSLLEAYEMNRVQFSNQAKDLLMSSLKKSNNPALTMFELGYYQTTANNPNYGLVALDNDEVKKIVDEASAKYPNHTGLAAIKRSLMGLVGSPAPDFTLPDKDGNPVKLSSFRGKYVLVDFWASWCAPCRDENPNVVKAYKQFKDKNFTILGVSLDRPGEKDNWMDAIATDQLKWNHVSDLMEWNSPVVSLYKIDGIPYNVLIDPSGIVIADKLYGEDLEKKLASVLK